MSTLEYGHDPSPEARRYLPKHPSASAKSQAYLTKRRLQPKFFETVLGYFDVTIGFKPSHSSMKVMDISKGKCTDVARCERVPVCFFQA
ncbi:hypothetical protein CYMTET_16596 [Cymbomonas tetramitiformis]|uniref:Uncharacterized protein n=1 Tax=Cymbomonas tetramitiformis TaxID=36881 RepID=A0AAE0GBM8_9CHLO|nr:hypothetical protein CYMTET_16596 [Cymbomonas tetramitiformis]